MAALYFECFQGINCLLNPISVRKTFGKSNRETIFRQATRKENGASEGIRTLDTHVGNVMLYQAELRSLPRSEKKLKEPPRNASSLCEHFSGICSCRTVQFP